MGRTKSKPKRRFSEQFSARRKRIFFTTGCPFSRSASAAGVKIENLRSVGEEAPYTKLLDVGLGAGEFSRSAGPFAGIHEALEAGSCHFPRSAGGSWLFSANQICVFSRDPL